jgi:hypothetical protein
MIVFAVYASPPGETTCCRMGPAHPNLLLIRTEAANVAGKKVAAKQLDLAAVNCGGEGRVAYMSAGFDLVPIGE